MRNPTEPRMKVLIVDDDPASLAILVTALAGSYQLFTAQNGFDAVGMAAAHRPDLVLLDVMMPDLDGLQVARVLRAEPTTADIPIVFVTAVDSLRDEQRGLEAGAVDYLTKPIDLELTRLRIQNHLELRRQRNLIQRQNELLLQQKAQLEATLQRVKRLEGLVTICMHCKKIRNEDRAWQQLERYISDHSDAIFSHGICPECVQAHWPS